MKKQLLRTHGREPKVVTKTYESMYHEAKTLEVELFNLGKVGLCG